MSVSVDSFLGTPPPDDEHGIVQVCHQHGRLFCDHRQHRRGRLRAVAKTIALCAVVVWVAMSLLFIAVTR